MRSIHLVRLQRTRLFGHGHMGKGNTNSSSRSETFFSFQNCSFLFLLWIICFLLISRKPIINLVSTFLIWLKISLCAQTKRILRARLRGWNWIKGILLRVIYPLARRRTWRQMGTCFLHGVDHAFFTCSLHGVDHAFFACSLQGVDHLYSYTA